MNMNDTSALLQQLKIDRAAAVPARRGLPPWLWAVAAACAVAAIVAAAWLLARAGAPAPASTAVAPPAGGAGASAPAKAAAAASVLDGSGYVVPRRHATVSSKITGKVTEMLVEEGDHVKQGAVLARLDDANVRAAFALGQSQLEAARGQVPELRVQLADAERQLARNRELAAQGMVSRHALDTAQAAADVLRARLAAAAQNVVVNERSLDVLARQLEDTVVRAPFAGVLTVKNAQPGEMVSPLSAGGAGTRTGIGTLVDMDSLEIEVDVNENFIQRVRPGQPVTARLNAYPDWEIPAEVIAVVPTADRGKATVKVRVGFKQRDARILPDMGARVSFR